MACCWGCRRCAGDERVTRDISPHSARHSPPGVAASASHWPRAVARQRGHIRPPADDRDSRHWRPPAPPGGSWRSRSLRLRRGQRHAARRPPPRTPLHHRWPSAASAASAAKRRAVLRACATHALSPCRSPFARSRSPTFPSICRMSIWRGGDRAILPSGRRDVTLRRQNDTDSADVPMSDRQCRRFDGMRQSAMDFATRAIHAGQPADPSTGATITPIFQTSTYTQQGLGENKGYEYSRTGNPTRAALETCLAALENATHGLAFASGMAATTATLSILRPGDEIIAGDDLYGGTYRAFERVLRPMGVTTRYVSARRIEEETPTNPLLSLVDIAALGDLARERGVTLVVYYSFATSFLQYPLGLVSQIVVHSTSKYINGHSDV